MPLINPTGFLPADYYTLLALFASNANAQGASLIGVEDSGAHFTATNLEAVLAELYTDIGTSVGSVTKTSLGLGNVDNTSDVNKPVSTAQQTALNLKANLNAPALVNPTVGTQSANDNSTKAASTAYADAAALNTHPMTVLSNSLIADVNLNNTANYFDGPQVAQGTTGTFFASGTISLIDSGGGAQFSVKLWDGTTVIASARAAATAVNVEVAIALSGAITNPAGNIRISARDISATTGRIMFNATGNSKDSTVTAIRVA